ETFPLEEYGSCELRCNEAPPDKEPWRPFRSCLDFEAAELALQTSMSDEQTDILFNLLHCASSGKDQFMLTSHDEAVTLWDLASYKCMGFIKDEVKASYKNVDRTFKLHYHSLWDWALDLLNLYGFIQFTI
ncbi:hypothetical protein BJV74DRAFT_725097, partial [Russula compacta]